MKYVVDGTKLAKLMEDLTGDIDEGSCASSYIVGDINGTLIRIEAISADFAEDENAEPPIARNVCITAERVKEAV